MTTNLLTRIQTRSTKRTLPDVNAETYPFEDVQRYLDQAAFMSFFAVAGSSQNNNSQPVEVEDWFQINGGYVLNCSSALHAFESTFDDNLVHKQIIRERTGRLQFRLQFAPTTLTSWTPGSEPAPRIFDPWRPQTFVATKMMLGLGGPENAFSVYAIGQTYPVTIDGRNQVILCAVGNIIEGFGSFAGLEGTICLQGSLTPELGFQGNVTCRIIDPDGQIYSKKDSPKTLTPMPATNERSVRQCDAATYISLRVEKQNRTVRTEYGPPTESGLVTLLTPAVMNSIHCFPFKQPDDRIRFNTQSGRRVARLGAKVVLDILAPAGTAASPNDFQTTNVYTFMDKFGNDVGTITAFIGLGKSFNLEFPEAPGQLGMRFGGFGPIEIGTGVFEGVQGTIIDNSAIGVAPHVVSGMHTFRLVDPAGSFRERVLEISERPPVKKPTIHLVTTRSSNNSTGEQSASDEKPRVPRRDGPKKLPDLNRETYPFDQVLDWLNEAAFFNCYSMQDRSGFTAIYGSNNRVIGFQLVENLHRFHIAFRPSSADRFPNISNTVGEAQGSFVQRWMFIPDDFYALPNSQIPETTFDPTRSQRFVMLDGRCSFDRGNDGFYGFGTGLTYPSATDNSGELVIASVGNIMKGFGSMSGAIGTYTHCGDFSPDGGFRGNLLCRVLDPQGRFRASGKLDPVTSQRPEFIPDAKYIVIHGKKRDRSVKTNYSFDENGEVNGLDVRQELHALELNFNAHHTLQSSASIGPLIGDMSARVQFNILDPGAPGTSLSPIPFQSVNQFRITDSRGQTIGGFSVGDGEGRTFNLELPQAPGQRALRFGVFAPITQGYGVFKGVRGMLTDNSVVAVEPHAVSTCYVLRIV